MKAMMTNAWRPRQRTWSDWDTDSDSDSDSDSVSDTEADTDSHADDDDSEDESEAPTAIRATTEAATNNGPAGRRCVIIGLDENGGGF